MCLLPKARKRIRTHADYLRAIFTLDDRMPFGPYEGKRIRYLPREYARELVDRGPTNSSLLELLKQVSEVVNPRT